VYLKDRLWRTATHHTSIPLLARKGHRLLTEQARQADKELLGWAGSRGFKLDFGEDETAAVQVPDPAALLLNVGCDLIVK